MILMVLFSFVVDCRGMLGQAEALVKKMDDMFGSVSSLDLKPSVHERLVYLNSSGYLSTYIHKCVCLD